MKTAPKNTINIARIILVSSFFLLAIWAITLENDNLVIGYSGIAKWLTTALTSVGPELAGIVIGVITIDYLNEKRQDDLEKKRLRSRLIREMGSGNNAIARRAIEELRVHEWLADGSLYDSDLTWANLQSAGLKSANLKQTQLRWANLNRAVLTSASLEGADLLGADMQAADFFQANLENARLKWADLRGARFREANLQKANLTWTKLQKVNFKDADLRGANLRGATYDDKNQFLQAKKLDKAIMPDGQKYEVWLSTINNQEIAS